MFWWKLLNFNVTSAGKLIHLRSRHESHCLIEQKCQSSTFTRKMQRLQISLEGITVDKTLASALNLFVLRPDLDYGNATERSDS